MIPTEPIEIALTLLDDCVEEEETLTHVEDAWDGLALLGALNDGLQGALAVARAAPAMHDAALVGLVEEALRRAEWEAEEALASVRSPQEGDLRIAGRALRAVVEGLRHSQRDADALWPGVFPPRRFKRVVSQLDTLEVDTWARRDLELRLQQAVDDADGLPAPTTPGEVWLALGLVGPVVEHLDRLLTGYERSRYKRKERKGPLPACVGAALRLSEPLLLAGVEVVTAVPLPSPCAPGTLRALVRETRALADRAARFWPDLPFDADLFALMDACMKPAEMPSAPQVNA